MKRDEKDILQDLESLCESDGFAQVIAYFCMRDNFIYFEDKIKPDDLGDIKSTNRLIRSEISLLIGLMVKKPISLNVPDADNFLEYLNTAEALLEELHDALTSKIIISTSQESAQSKAKLNLEDGVALREPIFYAGEYAYMFQYRDFAFQKYHYDNDWLHTNKGFSIDCTASIINAIIAVRQKKLSDLLSGESSGIKSNINIFLFTVDEVALEADCDKVELESFISAFSYSSQNNNASLTTVNSYNEANAYPIIKFGEHQYLLFQEYSLTESVYETPFFWMLQDKKYRSTAQDNRGLFTEEFSFRQLQDVLGKDSVFKNVKIKDAGGNDLGEIDVLAIYADRAIVLQAKSKKLTIEARGGDDAAIQRDFNAAIQKGYDQGFDCSRLISEPKNKLIAENGSELSVRRKFEEIFIFCVISEYYPALAHQSDLFLKVKNDSVIKHPYVMDVFFLDVLCEILDSPLHFFNFVHRRTKYNKRINSESELAVLSYHLVNNLFIQNDVTNIHLADDFSADLDSAMYVRRDGLAGDSVPSGILTKFKGTLLPQIIRFLEQSERDRLLDIGYLLLHMDSNSLRNFLDACECIVSATALDLRQHDFSLGDASGGITVHSSHTIDNQSMEKLAAHCAMKKYQNRADNWFGLMLKHSPSDAVRGAVGLKFTWEESESMDEAVEAFPSHKPKDFPEAIKAFKSLTSSRRNPGRNEPCICGSGLKYKKCCLNK